MSASIISSVSVSVSNIASNSNSYSYSYSNSYSYSYSNSKNDLKSLNENETKNLTSNLSEAKTKTETENSFNNQANIGNFFYSKNRGRNTTTRTGASNALAAERNERKKSNFYFTHKDFRSP